MGEMDNAYVLLGILGCGLDSLPSFYLNFPLVQNLKSNPFENQPLGDFIKDFLGWKPSISLKEVDWNSSQVSFLVS